MSKQSKYNENIFCQTKWISKNINFVICKIASFRNKYIQSKKQCTIVNFIASVYLRTYKLQNYSEVQMKISRLLFFLCSYSTRKEEHHHTVRSFVKVYRLRNGTQTRLTNYSRRWVISVLCRFGPGSFRPNLDSNFDFFFFLFINPLPLW